MFRTLFTSLSASKRAILLLGLAYLSFIALPMPDAALGVSWKRMRLSLDMPVQYAGFITTTLTLSSAFSSVVAGWLFRKFRPGALLALGVGLTGCALLGYAGAPFFALVLLLTIPLGLGEGIINTVSNAFVAKNCSSRAMCWLHMCSGLGNTFGAGIITLLFLADVSWRSGYLTMASFHLACAAVFLLSRNLWPPAEASAASASRPTGANAASSAEKPRLLRLWRCPLCFYLYTGIEQSFGLWSAHFLSTCRNVPEIQAGYAVTAYWAMLAFGRFLLGFLANRVGDVRMIRISMALTFCAALLLAIPGSVWTAFVSLGLVGFGMSSFYPSMMHATPKRFDEATATLVFGFQGGGGMLGIATIPALFGFLAKNTTFELLPVLALVFCPLILLFEWQIDRRRA